MSDEVIIALIGSLTTIIGIIIGVVERRKRKVAEQSMPDRQTKPDLIYHPLFAELDAIEQHFMTRYDTGDSGRTELAIELVVNKIRIWRPILEDLAKEAQDCYNLCQSSSSYCNRVYNMNMQVLNKGLQAYTNWHKRKDNVTGNYIPIKALRSEMIYRESCRNTMDIYIKKFTVWHQSREAMVEIAIQEYSNSPVSHDCYDKQYDIFTTYQFAFLQMKLDAEHSLKALNGDITGKKFLGKTVGPVYHND